MKFTAQASVSVSPVVGMRLNTILLFLRRFHCDDAFAVGLLLQLPEYRDAAVIRTRDAHDIERADVVVDVGGVYGTYSIQAGFEKR